MPNGSGMSRRRALGLGAAAFGTVAFHDVLTGPASALASTGAGTRAGLSYFTRFGVTEQLIQDALATALRERRRFRRRLLPAPGRQPYVLEDGAVNRAFTSVGLGVGVRVVKGDQTGYGYTEELTPEGLKLAARTAAAIASGPGRPGPQQFHVSGELPSRYAVQTPWVDVRPERKLPLLRTVNEKAQAADPRVRKVRVYFTDESSAVLVADSEGRILEDLQPMTTMGLTCVAEQDGRREENYYNVAARDDISYYSPERVERMVRECVKNTVVLFDATPAPAGEMPVVLAAGSSGILLHEAIGHGMEADFNRKNVSIYSDKIGKPIAKSFVNIVDDGTQEHARGAINVDDEGNVAGARCWSRTASSAPTCTTASRPSTTASSRPATAVARATSTRRCRACATPTCCPARTSRRRSSPR